MAYPINFSSQKEYDGYLACLSKLKPGDRLFFSHYPIIEGIYLGKTSSVIMLISGPCEVWSVLIGRNNPDKLYASSTSYKFFPPGPGLMEMYIRPAAKICSLIKTNNILTYWAPYNIRINSIMKYVQKEKTGKKASKKKPIRSRR